MTFLLVLAPVVHDLWSSQIRGGYLAVFFLWGARITKWAKMGGIANRGGDRSKVLFHSQICIPGVFCLSQFEVSRDHGEQKKWGFARICSF